MQIDVGKDIHDQVEAAKTEIRETGVDQAGNAGKFDDRTPTEWTADLDQRYAAEIHDHEGQSVYRRYMKHFNSDVDEVLLEHDLGRFPLVDAYELLPVVDKVVDDLDLTNCKILFFHGHIEADKLGLRRSVYRDRALRGIAFERILSELGVEYTDDSSIADVVNDWWNAFLADPNDDDIEHCQSPWVDECCEKNRTVGEQRKSGDWDDLYISIWPRKCAVGAALELDAETDGPAGLIQPACRVLVEQINYDTLYAKVNWFDHNPDDNQELPLDLMFLLRI